MSISQVKKRFEEFQTYLARDTEGQRRLKLLKDDVNVLRNQLTAAQHSEANAIAEKDLARQRADKAEQELNELRMKQASIEDANGCLRSRVAALEALLDDNDDQQEQEGHGHGEDEEYRQFKSVLKSLKKHLRYAPRATNAFYLGPNEDKTLEFDRREIAKGWSRNDLWVLGATVAIMCDGKERVVIRNTQRVQMIKGDDSVARHLIDWLKNILDHRETIDTSFSKLY